MSLVINDIIGVISVGVAVSALATAIAGALRAGVLKRVHIAGLELETPSDEARKLHKELKASISKGKDIPFEIEQLANYYTQILAQSKISFWFSLIFASLGFVIIVVAAFLYTDGSGTATTAQFVAGIIMDAVAGLFFVQSRNAQKSMADFFDKLRSDRMQMESRNLSESIVNEEAKDALKVHYVFHKKEGPSKHIQQIAKSSVPRRSAFSFHGCETLQVSMTNIIS